MKEILISNISAQTISTNLNNTFDISSVGQLVGFGLNIVIGIGWAVAFVFFALGFIGYITSKGEKQKAQDAQQTITYAVIGGVGLLLLGAIKSVVEGTLGTVLPEGFVPGEGASE